MSPITNKIERTEQNQCISEAGEYLRTRKVPKREKEKVRPLRFRLGMAIALLYSKGKECVRARNQLHPARIRSTL